jgi:acetolactate synthase-1/2/3 large subunit
MVKLSDYVIDYLAKTGVSTVFTLTGGGIMHLVESLGNSDLRYVCCHHEQSCSIAAQAYGLYAEELGVCLVTTGPGGTNALTGAAAAYADSTPVLFITGQVKREDFASLRGVRQYGAQENDIISMARPVTKYAEVVMEPESILYHLQKAVYLATHGRKGPVWLDIPLDVQAAIIAETELAGFAPEENKAPNQVERAVEQTYKALAGAKRPLILAGHGVIAAKAQDKLAELVEALHIPVMATWRALSVFDTENRLFFGSPGLQAPRYSNLILQGADLLIVVGSRLDNIITAFNEEHFAFRAAKIVVDIDETEIDKLKTPKVTKVVADAGDYLAEMLEQASGFAKPDFSKWLADCLSLKERFPIWQEKQPEQPPQECVDLYHATRLISTYCAKDDVIVISSTSRCNTAGHMAFSHRSGQMTISSMGMGAMGFALPSAVGAYFASGGKRPIVIEGDGSLQLNIQELQTIQTYRIPAKLFVFNNNGYAAIATMQERNFAGHYVGCNPQSGVCMPDLEKIAGAYGIAYRRIEKNSEAEAVIKQVLEAEGAVVCDMIGSLKFDEIPKCISSVNAEGKRVSALLENPYPFLADEEIENIYRQMGCL